MNSEHVIKQAGENIARQLKASHLHPLAELEGARLAIKDAFAAGRVFSYAVASSVNRAWVGMGCAGYVAGQAGPYDWSDVRSNTFMELADVNDFLCTNGENGRLTNIEPIERALEIAYEELCK